MDIRHDALRRCGDDDRTVSKSSKPSQLVDQISISKATLSKGFNVQVETVDDNAIAKRSGEQGLSKILGRAV